MEEIWKDVDGYEGYYQVSSFGRVRSLDRVVNNHFYGGRILCLASDSDGYKVVGLHKNGSKTVKVHRLVAQAFIPNPQNLPEVNHKDENKKNNFYNNLEWCTTKYNLTYGHRLDCAIGERNSKSKLNEKQVAEIREIYKKGDLQFGQSALAKKYGVRHPTIAAIVKGKSWKHILKEEQ
jgi:hypothetical protein